MNDKGKPSWKNAPEWANWLAVDSTGLWYWYAEEPYWKNGCGGEWHTYDRVEYAGSEIIPESSLESRS